MDTRGTPNQGTASASGSRIPASNLEIFQTLFEIEVGLRELIVSECESKFGARWHKDVLPGDVLKKYRSARAREQGESWLHIVPHHPIYYVDFPDLARVIESKRAWEEVFKVLLGRKDIVTATLRELEPVRNKIAHNRMATSNDMALVRAAHDKLTTLFGAERLKTLTLLLSTEDDLITRLANLQTECNESYRRASTLESLGTLPNWDRVRSQWWFDDDYLCEDISTICECFSLFEQYAGLPRRRGSGHEIERWVRKHPLSAPYEAATSTFGELLNKQ